MKKNMTKVDELREVLKTKKENEGAQKNQEHDKHIKHDKEVEELTSKLNVAEEQSKDWHNKLIRLMAEFENYKKRVVREKHEQVKFANEKLVVELVPILDDLGRVFDHSHEDVDIDKILDGVDMVRNSLRKTLSNFGLSEIEVKKGEPFNPLVHEALSCIETNDYPDHSVLDVYRKGYKLGDRVVRAAQVTVAKKKDEEL
ncbi:MAG: nucleotide exchange factor GrpE [Deltaproteobacteria bacterium CG07_land_8_20_14_0_80_38_7]|nr:MAG: nucleotide exchange factor GrpE [Deltaproteobacteria bacterium CG07_land_8_20_14_0_80_38_7]